MTSLPTRSIASIRTDAAGKALAFSQGSAQVDASLVEIAPGTVLPPHKHPFPRMGYCLAGKLQVTNLESGQVSVYSTGDFALEAVDVWHEGENVGADTVRLLVIDIVAPGASNLIFR